MDRSASYGFLLTFHSNHALSRTVSEIDGDFSRKVQKIPTSVYFAPLLTGNYVSVSASAQGVGKTGMMRLPDGRKRFRMGLAV